MAKFENMTLSYTQVASIPFKTRKSASGSLLDALSRDLTPGQRAALFPSYVNQVYASGGYGETRKEASLPPPSGGVSTVPPSVDVVGPPKPSKGLKTGLDIIPGGMIPDPVTGKPMRVPDQKVISNTKTKALLNLISKAEGTTSYDTQFGYQDVARQKSGGKPLTQMTINEVRQLMSSTPKNKRAMGKYQFVPGTFNDVVKQMGLSGDEIFSPEMQDKMIIHRLTTTRGMDRWMDGTLSDEEFMHRLAQEFASLPSPKNNGNSLYGGVGLNKSTPIISLDELSSNLSQIKNMPDEDVVTTARLENVYDLPQEEKLDTPTAVALRVGEQTTIDGVNATTLSYGNEDASGLGGVPVLKAEGMEGVYDNNTATKTAKPYEGVVLHVTGKQSVSEQLEYQRNGEGSRKGGYGYQYIIDKEGNIVEAANPETDRPNQVHSEGRHGRTDLQNPNSLSIGFITGGGNPTEEQLEALRKFLPQAYKKFGIPTTLPDGTPNYPVGHGETQFNRGSAFGLGPNETPEGSVMADAVRNENYWKSLEAYDPSYAAPVATASASPAKSIESAQISGEEPSVPLESSDQVRPIAPRYPSATPVASATPSPAKPATATATQRISRGTMGGYNAAAGGAEITDPSMIISEDGKKVTRVAETGPEKISVMPRHKSSDVFQEQQVMFQQDREEKSREDIAKKDIAEVKSTPMMSNFGRPMDSGQSASINNSMPKISLSANKAFADAKMVGRFNKADVDGDMGIVYINRGYA